MSRLLEVLPSKQALIEKALTVVTQKIEVAIQKRGICTEAEYPLVKAPCLLGR